MKSNILIKEEKFLEFVVALLFIIIGVSLRLLPHPPNFTPIGALALFGGAYFSKKIALIIPITTMVISDLFMGYYEPKLMISVYISFIFCVVIGFGLNKKNDWKLIFRNSILSALFFFFLTNFSVWLFTPWYTKDFIGLTQCYLLALPFFRNTLLSNLLYATIFFGAYETARSIIKKKIIEKSPVLLNYYGRS